MTKTLSKFQKFQAVLVSLIVLVLSFIVLKTNLLGTNHVFEVVSPQTISAIILPHHDLASAEREASLRQIVGRIEPKTIILVSPNHFDTGGYNIETTTRQWRLTNSYLEPDSTRIKELNIPDVDSAFNREHGITNLLDPLKNVFPDAKIIPIIIKQDTPAGQIDDLSKKLAGVCANNCLLVASVDFSHYQPASVASIHDLMSIKVLSNLDDKLVWKTEVDSNPTLYLAIEWAKSYKTNSFHLSDNTNSGLLTHNPDTESTSYVMGWFEAGDKTEIQSKTFVAGYNLSQIDARLRSGTDNKIDLNDNHNMGMLCYTDKDFCNLNRLFWSPVFYRPILNGLVVTGVFDGDQYKLILTPTDPTSHQALRGQAKLDIINQIRQKLGLSNTQIGDGYDTIEINQNLIDTNI